MLGLREFGVQRVVVVLASLILGGLGAYTIFGATIHRPQPTPLHFGTDWRSSPIGPGAEETDGLPPDLGRLPFSPILPGTDDSSNEVTTAWARIDGDDPALAVKLQSGVFIMESPAESIDFPTDQYYKQLQDGLPGASVIQVNKASAMQIQSSETFGAPSSVDVILEGVHISIIGDVGQDVAQLVALADSLPATGSGAPLST
jgi:hypothetical protein